MKKYRSGILERLPGRLATPGTGCFGTRKAVGQLVKFAAIRRGTRPAWEPRDSLRALPKETMQDGRPAPASNTHFGTTSASVSNITTSIWAWTVIVSPHWDPHLSKPMHRV